MARQITKAFFIKAVSIVVEDGRASSALLQRKLQIDYPTAARLLLCMVENGVVSEPDGTQPRKVLITREDIPLLAPHFVISDDKTPSNTHGKKARAKWLQVRYWLLTVAISYILGFWLDASIYNEYKHDSPLGIFLICAASILLLLAFIVGCYRVSLRLLIFIHKLGEKKDAKKNILNVERRRSYFVGGAILAIIILAIAIPQIPNQVTIADANPTMVKLAQQAGMSKKGELIFLRTNPQLVSDSELAQHCPDATENNDGFIEQGCYVPNQSDPSTGRIYLRQMPSALYNLEVTTAAYEMLHPAYISLTTSDNSSGAAPLNAAIEAGFNQNASDSTLTSLVSEFAKTEPSDRDLELFSILGTEYSNLPASLTSYYAPYFTHINVNVTDNDQIFSLFQNDENQLNQLQQTIKQDDDLANTAYADSVSWANVGNQYEDDYNYNIYSNDIDDENNAINQYNSLLTTYNTLVTEYMGQQPQGQLPTVQTQQSQ